VCTRTACFPRRECQHKLRGQKGAQAPRTSTEEKTSRALQMMAFFLSKLENLTDDVMEYVRTAEDAMTHAADILKTQDQEQQEVKRLRIEETKAKRAAKDANVHDPVIASRREENREKQAENRGKELDPIVKQRIEAQKRADAASSRTGVGQ
jgi:hypothetical protein